MMMSREASWVNGCNFPWSMILHRKEIHRKLSDWPQETEQKVKLATRRGSKDTPKHLAPYFAAAVAMHYAEAGVAFQ